LRRDLHDGLGPTLAALHLQAGVLRRLIATDPEAATALVEEFRSDIRTAVEDIRRVVYALRPPALDELGLVAAVQAQAERCNQPPPGLQVEVEAPAMLPPLPAAVEVAAYRIVQEALANVVHHARATHCCVRLVLDEQLAVEVTDDGDGLPAQRKRGVGLVSMRERAVELGGTCHVGPAAGGGTKVVAYLPLLEE
jgi:signal transduction histidine kinase